LEIRMPIDIKVPAVGESISEGTIVRWVKNEGEQVQQDEPLYELETEKATQEVPAPASGVVHIQVKAGQRVAIGSVIGSIDTNAVAKPAAPPATSKSDGRAAAPAAPKEAPAFSPAARAQAAEHGVDVAGIEGTGRHGVVLKEDVQRKIAAPPPAPTTSQAASSATPQAAAPAAKPRAGDLETRTPMSAIRMRIADRLLAAQKGTASLTTFNEADMSAILELRTRYKEDFKKRHDVGLGFMSFFVKAVVEALKAYPLVNSRIDGGDIVEQHYYNFGVAVSTEKGLMVPVLHDVDRMSFAEIEQAIADVAVRARDGKITLADLQGGTFTITNGGIFGSMMSTPILNTPQAAILGMHTIQKRPVVREDHIVIRPMMYLALTYDHRLIDGREAVQFLVRIKECIENPERMLLNV
jgi:2-oxoglutarate dehydrogenase E2 component (dihydrolipoamide succinyltransferase)